MITGCHPGECHYMEQNYKALRRFLLLRRVLKGMGIEPERVKLVWASAAEGARFASETTLFVEEIRKLGPLNWGKQDNGPSTKDHDGPSSIVHGLRMVTPAAGARSPFPHFFLDISGRATASCVGIRDISARPFVIHGLETKRKPHDDIRGAFCVGRANKSTALAVCT